MFCVKCGKEDVETIDGLCVSCFLEGKKFISFPHHIDLYRCANCGFYSVSDEWIEKTQDVAVVDAALSVMAVLPEAKVVSVGTKIDTQEEKTFVVHVQADIEIRGVKVTDEASTIVRLKNTVCKRCSRQLGSYYEAIIQVRSGEKNLDDDIRDEIVRRVTADVERMSKNNRDLFISKVTEVTGGVDFYLSSTSTAKNLTRGLVETYGAEEKESSSLIGQSSQGLEVYRVTFLVRLPPYHIGDVVISNGKPYKLTSFVLTGAKLMDLATFREGTVKRNELEAVRVAVKNSDVQHATVVSVSDKEIQVLHPSNYSTVDLRIPAGAQIGETVRVVDIDGELLYVP
jgi:nonsense-mediated mRNA decay protein 3